MKVISLRIEYLRLKQISQEDKHILYSQRDSELATFSVASIRQPAPHSMLRKLRPRACVEPHSAGGAALGLKCVGEH